MRKCVRCQAQVGAHSKCIKHIFFFSPHKYSNPNMESTDSRILGSKIQKGSIFYSAATTLQILIVFYTDYTTAC